MTPQRLIEPARLAGTTLMRTQSDDRLVDLVRAGHAAAFEAIVQRYRKPLLAYCSRLLPTGRAEDAVQQTFLSAYQAMTREDADLNLRPWLYRIAHNSSLNLLRQNGWTHEQLDENFDGVERPDQAFERREDLRSALDAVKALPERQRDALVLRELEGRRYDEIASELGVGDGAVRQLLHRARTTLRAGASAITPVGLLDRLMAITQSADPAGRVAEVAAGVGGGVGIAKIGVAVLATGALAGGAATAPLTHHSHHSGTNTAETRHSGSGKSGSATPPTLTVDDRHGSGGQGSDDSSGQARLGLGLGQQRQGQRRLLAQRIGQERIRQQRILGRHQRRLERRLERRRRQVRLERQRLRIERQLGIQRQLRVQRRLGQGQRLRHERRRLRNEQRLWHQRRLRVGHQRWLGFGRLRVGLRLRLRQGHHRARRRRRRLGQRPLNQAEMATMRSIGTRAGSAIAGSTFTV